MNAATRRCTTCGGDCHWSDDAWTCTACGDEWGFDHDPKYGAPGDEEVSSWEVIKSERATVYHRRILGPDYWLAVRQLPDGSWRWRRRHRPAHSGVIPAAVLDSGTASTWQAARAAADRSTR